VAAGFAYTEVLHMPWTDARDFAAAAARAGAQRKNAATLQAAVARRMAHACRQPGLG